MKNEITFTDLGCERVTVRHYAIYDSTGQLLRRMTEAEAEELAKRIPDVRRVMDDLNRKRP